MRHWLEQKVISSIAYTRFEVAILQKKGNSKVEPAHQEGEENHPNSFGNIILLLGLLNGHFRAHMGTDDDLLVYPF